MTDFKIFISAGQYMKRDRHLRSALSMMAMSNDLRHFSNSSWQWSWLELCCLHITFLHDDETTFNVWSQSTKRLTREVPGCELSVERLKEDDAKSCQQTDNSAVAAIYDWGLIIVGVDYEFLHNISLSMYIPDPN